MGWGRRAGVGLSLCVVNAWCFFVAFAIRAPHRDPPLPRYESTRAVETRKLLDKREPTHVVLDNRHLGKFNYNGAPEIRTGGRPS